ncbi:hypothetical protein Sango_2932400 [Sesamum angolense]|uniref:RNase H type-1 domain-containing protein n=1 Tax=Sesamum angolense TaxID=2727404 RepID=A0AAE1T570_9LAMI|nr:hypothetical protein Sango_2932400 [Sesamum angolense]
MKAKYFPHSFVLEAHIGSNSSFAWRNIMSAQDLVKVGFKRRIGSASSVRVCRDPWIPKSHSFQPLIRPRQLDSSTTVASLIDIDQGIGIVRSSKNVSAPKIVSSSLLFLLSEAIIKICFFSTILQQGFREANARGHRQSCPPVLNRWRHPLVDSIKINFDGATFKSSGEIGIGVVARYFYGACLDWISHRIFCPAAPLIAEVLAAREAISFALKSNWGKVILEGDCADLFHLLNCSAADFSFSGPLVNDIHFLCSSLDCVFSLVRRTENSVDHCLQETQALVRKALCYYRTLLTLHLLPILLLNEC